MSIPVLYQSEFEFETIVFYNRQMIGNQKLNIELS